MGSFFGKSAPAPDAPDVLYFQTVTVRDIIANVNESHPYVANFLRCYPYSVNYHRLDDTDFQWVEHSSTQHSFDSHIRGSIHSGWQLSITKKQYAVLNAIMQFSFAPLPAIRTSMTVGDLRDICNIANRAALENIFKYSPDASSWACVPIPTINMHIEMTSVPDKTTITLSARQAKELAAFLKQPFVEDATQPQYPSAPPEPTAPVAHAAME